MPKCSYNADCDFAEECCSGTCYPLIDRQCDFSYGTFVGIGIGSFVFVAILITICFCYFVKKARRNDALYGRTVVSTRPATMPSYTGVTYPSQPAQQVYPEGAIVYPQTNITTQPVPVFDAYTATAGSKTATASPYPPTSENFRPSATPSSEFLTSPVCQTSAIPSAPLLSKPDCYNSGVDATLSDTTAPPSYNDATAIGSNRT